MVLSLLRPLPPQLAQSRLKSNLFALFLSFLIRTIFTPYLVIKRLLISGVDRVQGVRYGQHTWGSRGVWWCETLLASILCWNIAEATFSIYFPAKLAPPEDKRMKFTPSKPSSPLTRSYPSPSSPSTQTSQQTQQAAAGTPTRALPSLPSSSSLHLASTPHRSSPLASSTSHIFPRPTNSPSTPTGTGLFYDENSNASPSKIAQAQGPARNTRSQVQPQSQVTSTRQSIGVGGEFVLVEREEKEWVDNVWKGVRGKGVKVGL